MTCPICKGRLTVVTGGPDSFGNYDTDDCVCQTPCPTCRGHRKVYREHLAGGFVALDTVPGYDPRVTCPSCLGTGAAYTASEITRMVDEEPPYDEDLHGAYHRLAANHGIWFNY